MLFSLPMSHLNDGAADLQCSSLGFEADTFAADGKSVANFLPGM
jgi:hypothetical protein